LTLARASDRLETSNANTYEDKKMTATIYIAEHIETGTLSEGFATSREALACIKELEVNDKSLHEYKPNAYRILVETDEWWTFASELLAQRIEKMRCVYGSQNKDNKMTITVKIKNVYGREIVYPVCNAAKQFAALANTKTLTDDAINIIKSLGYSIEVETPTL